MTEKVVIALDSISEGYEEVYENGLDAVFIILSEVIELQETLEVTFQNIERTARNVAAVLALDL